MVCLQDAGLEVCILDAENVGADARALPEYLPLFADEVGERNHWTHRLVKTPISKKVTISITVFEAFSWKGTDNLMVKYSVHKGISHETSIRRPTVASPDVNDPRAGWSNGAVSVVLDLAASQAHTDLVFGPHRAPQRHFNMTAQAIEAEAMGLEGGRIHVEIRRGHGIGSGFLDTDNPSEIRVESSPPRSEADHCFYFAFYCRSPMHISRLRVKQATTPKRSKGLSAAIDDLLRESRNDLLAREEIKRLRSESPQPKKTKKIKRGKKKEKRRREESLERRNAKKIKTEDSDATNEPAPTGSIYFGDFGSTAIKTEHDSSNGSVQRELPLLYSPGAASTRANIFSRHNNSFGGSAPAITQAQPNSSNGSTQQDLPLTYPHQAPPIRTNAFSRQIPRFGTPSFTIPSFGNSGATAVQAQHSFSNSPFQRALPWTYPPQATHSPMARGIFSREEINPARLAYPVHPGTIQNSATVFGTPGPTGIKPAVHSPLPALPNSTFAPYRPEHFTWGDVHDGRVPYSRDTIQPSAMANRTSFSDIRGTTPTRSPLSSPELPHSTLAPYGPERFSVKYPANNNSPYYSSLDRPWGGLHDGRVPYSRDTIQPSAMANRTPFFTTRASVPAPSAMFSPALPHSTPAPYGPERFGAGYPLKRSYSTGAFQQGFRTYPQAAHPSIPRGSIFSRESTIRAHTVQPSPMPPSTSLATTRGSAPALSAMPSPAPATSVPASAPAPSGSVAPKEPERFQIGNPFSNMSEREVRLRLRLLEIRKARDSALCSAEEAVEMEEEEVYLQLRLVELDKAQEGEVG